jgi:dCTP deaminase
MVEIPYQIDMDVDVKMNLGASIVPDWRIRELVKEKNMIESFVERQKQNGVMSYGLDGYGYDIRIQSHFKEPDWSLKDLGINFEIDPKRILTAKEDGKLYHNNEFVLMKDADAIGGKIRIQPRSFIQVVSVEKLNMPDNVKAFSFLGKSSYSRHGIFPIITPIDEGYSGFITFSIVNPFDVPAIVYSGEGITQLVFFEMNSDCDVTYADKGGKYHGSEGIQGTVIK